MNALPPYRPPANPRFGAPKQADKGNGNPPASTKNQPIQASTTADTQFGKKSGQPDWLDKITDLERWGNGVRGAWQKAGDPGKLLRDAVIAGIFTLATSWLPGSQLVFIPLWLIGRLSYDTVTGFVEGLNRPKN